MAIKLSSLVVIITAFLVAGTLIWIGIVEEKTAENTVSQPTDVSLNTVSDKSSTIKVGWIGPLSGNDAAVGESMKRGVELAAKDLGTDYIETIFVDVQCDIKDAIKAVDKLLLENNVQVIISAVCEAAGLAINPIAQQARVVVISPNNTTAQFTDTGDYIYRTIPGNLDFGKFAAQTIIDENIKNIVTLYSDNEISSNSHEAFLKHWRDPALIAISEIFSPDATDFSTQLDSIKKINPDGILIITDSKVSALSAIKQINQANITARVFGSSVFSNQSFLSEISAFPKTFSVISPSRGSAEFIARFKETFNDSPELLAAQSYDAFIAIARSIEAGADNGPLIRDRLKTIQFEGASGYIQFDEKREVPNNWQVYFIKNGLLTLKKNELAPDFSPQSLPTPNAP